MKIYNIQLKRLTQTEADSKKDARKEGRNRAKGATRHATLHKDHSHSIHGARGTTPHEDGAEPEEKPRTEKAPRPKTASLKDNTQQVAKKPRTTHPRTHRVHI